MAKFSGTTILNSLGTPLPKELYQKIVASNKSFVGMAVAKDGKILTDFIEGELPYEAYEEIRTGLGEGKSLLYFGNFEKGFKEENRQPFTLLTDDKGNPELVVSLTGPFSSYEEKAGQFSPHFHAVNNYLMEKLKEIHGLVDGNMDKFMDALKSKTTHADMMRQSNEPFTIVLLSSSGRAVSWTNSEEMLQAPEDNPWGWVSNAHGYKLAAPSKASGILGKFKNIVKGEAPTPTPAETPDTREPVTPEKKDGDTVGTPFKPASTEGMVAIKPPQEVRSHKNGIKNWYKRFNSVKNKSGEGMVPSKWMECPEVYVKMELALKANLINEKGESTQGIIGEKMKAIASTTPIPQPEKKEEEAPADTGTPIFTPLVTHEDLATVKTKLKPKVLDLNSHEIMHPGRLSGTEKDLPLFAKAYGFKFDETIRWSAETLMDLGKKDLKALVMWAQEARHEFLHTLAKAEAGKPPAEKETPKPVTVPEQKKRAAGGGSVWD